MPKVCFNNSRLEGKYTQIGCGKDATEKNDDPRTVNDPVTLPLIVLTYRTEEQVFLAERIAGRGRWSRNFVFLVFIMYDSPGPVNDALDLCTVA